MPRVKVLLFGWVRRRLGEELEVEAESVRDVEKALVEAGLTEEEKKSLLIVPRRGEKERPLTEGDEVVVFPLVGGG